MKQIKSVILFLMSVVLVAFGSQDSKNPKNILKQLGDETKKVSAKIKEVKKDDNTAKTDTKKNEPKQQPVQQQPVPAVNTAQPQQPATNTPQQQVVPQQPVADANPNAQNPSTANENGLNGKKSNKRNRRNNNGLSKAPKHSRLKNSDPSTDAAPQEKPSNVKSQDSSPQSTGGSSSGSGSGSSGGSSSGGSSSGGGDSSSPE